MNTVLITGPTGIGKSKLVEIINKKVKCIVINTDSLQVYSSLSVITARPKPRSNYFLYGHIPVDLNYSVGAWLEDVKKILDDINLLNKYQAVIFVGGTGLYFTRLLNGIASIPRTDPSVRKKVLDQYKEKGLDYFLFKLKDFDPITFKNIDRNNPRRVLRAWEILESTGKSIGYWQKKRNPPLLLKSETKKIILNARKSFLDVENEKRFKLMLKNGAIDECRTAKNNGMTPGSQSFKAIGISELSQFFDGSLTLREVEKKGVIRTRQYSKRQMTWFRNNFADWISFNVEELNYSQIAEKIISMIN